MGYKEKYNKLVEAVKQLQKANPSDEGIQNWVNDNVPELRESEDERIRKSLINVFATHKDYEIFFGASVKDILAWLEKQGESKNIDSDDLGTLEIWEDAIRENKEKWQLSDWFVEATLLLVKKVKRIENNKTNKDVEITTIPESRAIVNKIKSWSEEDKKIRETLIGYFKNYKTQEEIGIKTFFGIPTDDIIAWLEKQGQRPQITWKPNEKLINALKWVLQNIPYNTHKEEIYELLEQLRRRKENKV